ncbi:acyl-CoA dehydrogenase family protein [Nocardia sp. NPDC059246]|uniref:acyl-CoA dehydrogenase family protein n=1 Tax=unclassified Nocardia TaxID=2637762 RepID=UPI0036BF001F
MRLEPTPEEKALRETVARIGARYGHSYFMAKTHAGEPPTELWRELGEQGFLGTSLPEEYGGGGQGLWTLTIVMEELAAAGCPLLPLVFSQAICGNLLAKYGTEEQKERWLRGVVTGEIRFSFAITEADAGSNSHNVTTRAKRVGDGWVLRGQKTFISGVEAADAIVVVARTGKHPKSGRGLVSLFVVDADDPAISRQHIPTAIQAPEKQWTLFFDDVKLGLDRLIGAENDGLRTVFDGLNPERVLGAAMSTGIGRYALDKAARYVSARQVWGVPIGSHQGVAHPLAEAKIELELARLMTYKAALLYEAGSPETGEAANMAKFSAGEAGVHCVDTAVQVHGGNGVALEYGLTDMWWLARLTKIAPVSREMVLNFVAEHSLHLPKSY